MNKFLIACAVGVLLLVVAIFVGPGLVDWNQYKSELSGQAERFTGRRLVIDGNLEVSVLPTPALIAHDVRLSNVSGGSAPDMVRLKSLQVRVALGPLLGGQVKVQTVHLVDPVIELERFADGRTNMEFAAVEKASETDAAQTETAQPSATPSADRAVAESDEQAFSLDNFAVENATVVYRDAVSGTVESVENLHATFAAASLSGPFESSGELVARGFPLSYDLSVGKIIEQRTAPLTLTVGILEGATKTTLSGAIVGMSDVPMFKGAVKATGENLAQVIQSFGFPAALPGLLGQSFGIEGEIEASARSASIGDLNFTLGRVVAKGSGLIEMDDAIIATLDLAVDNIDLDTWMALPEVDRATITPPVSKQAKNVDGEPKKSVTLTMPAKGNPEPVQSSNALPDNIDATLNLKVDSLMVKEGLIRQGRLHAELVGGEVTLHQLSAQLPGSADIALFGFVNLDDGEPGFDGELEIAVGDLHGVLGWLGASLPPVPADRLRKMTLASKVSATPKRITATALDMQFDSSRLIGQSVVRLGARLGVDADLTLDRINLDAYLKAPRVQPVIPAAANAARSNPTKAEANPDSQDNASAAKTTAFSGLRDLDVNLKGRIKSLVYSGTQAKNAVIDASLLNGGLDIRKLAVDKFAGATFLGSGQVLNLGGIPEMKGVRVDVKAGDLSRLFRLAGAKAPVNSKKMGAVSFKGKADGSALNPLIDITLKGAGASIAAAGKITFLPIIGGFNGKLNVQHKDLVGMMRSLGVKYRPGGKLGGVNLNSVIKADLSGLTLNKLYGQVGPVTLKGDAKVALGGPRTKITANLDTGKIDAGLFMPVSKNAFLSNPQTIVPAAWVAPSRPDGRPAFRRQVAVSTGRWPTDPIDLSSLKSFDADIKVRSKALAYGPYVVSDSDLAATVDAGVLHVTKLNGKLFGGTINARGKAKAASPPTLETVLSLKNLNVDNGLKAIMGESPAAGKAGLELTLQSSGFTVADQIAALAGQGNIALNGLKVRKTGKGSALSAALGLVTSLNRLNTSLSGRKKAGALADIGGSFTIDQGIARSNDLKLTSSVGNGQAQGTIDLSRWLIDVAGNVEMSDNVLVKILNKNQSSPTILPFTIKGKLDAPNVKLDTSKLGGLGLPIPGLEKVLKKKGVGKILNQLLPGLSGTGSQATPPPASGNTPPPPPPSPSAQPEKLDPKDLLKGLLKGLGG